MSDIVGLDSLYSEFAWLSGGMDMDVSEAIHEVTVEAKDKMADDFMPWDTGYMSTTTNYNLGYMNGSVFNISTHYAGFVDGIVPVINRPYTITPFIQPTVEYINSVIVGRIFKVVSSKAR